MTFLPIVERELRIAARLRATYRNRVIVVGAAIIIALLMLLFGTFSHSPTKVGKSMFATLYGLSFLFCVLDGARKTADALSEERREGTLGLLFLTDLKGYDVVLGELMAASTNSLCGLIAILPVLSLPLLMGGVTGGEFFRAALALTNVLFFSLCAGLWVSARSRDETNAMGGTLALVALILAVPFIGGRHLEFLSPAFAFSTAFENPYRVAAALYWRSLATTQVLSWLLLFTASRSVMWSWRQENATESKSSWRRRLSERVITSKKQRTADRAKWLMQNPILWLTTRNRTALMSLRILAATMAIIAAILLLWVGFSPSVTDEWAISLVLGFLGVNLLIKIRLVIQSCELLAEIKRSNLLELLLTTPLRGDQILRGNSRGLHQMFFVPTLVILASELFIVLALAINSKEIVSAIFILVVIAYDVLYGLEMLSLAWMGMWNGLSCKKKNQAITKTVLWGIIIPLLTSVFIPCIGIVGFLIWPIFWLVTSQQRLRLHFSGDDEAI